jgi:DNA-binding MurR/RpiR family transcriptional regulator
MKEVNSGELKGLRAALDACGRDGGGRRIYSDELAERAGRYALARRSGGAGLKEVATELGVWESQVVRWLKRVKRAGFQEVSVVFSKPLAAQRMPPVAEAVRPPGLVVTSPKGFRIEGLTLMELRELWGGL